MGRVGVERIPGEHRAPGVGHSDPFLHPGPSVTQLMGHFYLHIALIKLDGIRKLPNCLASVSLNAR